MTALTSAPSTLIYLFADRIVDTVLPARWFLRGTMVPCKDVQVRTDKLASLLLASVFWSLREQRLIKLAVITKQRWIFDRLRVEAIPLKQVSRPGLEGVIGKSMGGGSEDVTDVICKTLAESITDPWNDVVKAAVGDAIASGYIEVRAEGGITGAGQSQRDLRPKCQEIATLENQFDNFTSLWERFRSSEPVLYEQLLHRCANALLSCREKYFP